ncbi:MAG: hypothetical protein Q4D58_08010 [Synergistaceae bacterium]|nr:hypothetical protein [Synergistaceae bacterium]
MGGWLLEHRWRIIVAVLAAIITGAVLIARADVLDSRHASEMNTLRGELVKNEKKLLEAEKQVEGLRAQLKLKQEEIERLRQENDRRIREATASAYRKARDMHDDDLLAAYNRLISSARSRNAERERADTGYEE